MQKYTEILFFDSYTPAQFTHLVSLSMDSLKWQNTIHDNNEVEGESKATAWSWGEKVCVQVYQNEAWITSEYRQWKVPIGSRNRKNVDALRTTIQSLQEQYTAEELDSKNVMLQKEAEEFLFDFEKRYENGGLSASEKVGIGGYYATYALIAVVLIIYFIMVVSGVSFIAPSAEDVFKWGGNFHPYTTGGEYWRLITYIFIHIGVVHVFFNAYALLSIGIYLEPIIGRWKIILCFLLTGVLAGTFSMWWDNMRISAGSSGAIFGLYGVFIALMVAGVVDKKVKIFLLSSIGFFVGINLLYGLKEGIDNAAHIGGLISGVFLGFLMAAEVKWIKFHLLFKGLSIALPLAIVLIYINTAHTKDADFSLKLIEIATLDSDAEWPITSKKGKSDNQLAGEIERTSIPKWSEVATILKKYKPDELNTFNRNVQGMLTDYTSLRLKEAQLYIQKADDSVNFSSKELDLVQEQIRSKQRVLAELKR